jgi:uncharacterized membrane protein
MPNHRTVVAKCQICKLDKPQRELLPAELIRPAIARLIERDNPGWQPSGFVCTSDLNHYRMQYVRDVLQMEPGEVSALEQEVLESIKKNEPLAANIYADFDAKRARGERLADKIAEFGGSWKFIICFAAVIGAWIAINSAAILQKQFDPYPFILLNLVLSCLAALQAPLIMMSQRRMEARDRLRGEHDYQVNLKAELEIRHLHEKLDHLLKQQWMRLLEIQEIQMELMKELSERKLVAH